MYDKDKLAEILTNIEFRAVNDVGKQFIPTHEVYKIISEKMKR